MEWVLAHMEDADFNDPLPAPSGSAPGQAAAAAPSPESLAMLESMEFSQKEVWPAGLALLMCCQANTHQTDCVNLVQVPDQVMMVDCSVFLSRHAYVLGTSRMHKGQGLMLKGK